MLIFKKVIVFFLFIIFFLTDALYGQYVPSKERGDAKYRRKIQMEGNRIRTTVFNYGMTGREGSVPITEQTPYEWPKNTGQVYLAVQGYFNENNPTGFATSTLPETWPASWPDRMADQGDPSWVGKWNGYFGKD